ncbi:uncharacterized protein LOC131219044 [Magnolia sinica]|uniref:uncharacterized protein LOC131219044 n=1 Tax=Magnolia sinica TaxID=86752 RepID=UPI00265AF122|nr:uncharacterized protein LOC131219044 [Magnolia sinica]
MAICDFNMIFTYVIAGWEGVAHDSRVLMDAVLDPTKKFPLPPPDKYYLVDAAYTHTRGFMAPYRNVRYWLGDFRSGGRPTSKEEVFNHMHAKLRNVIERSFGVLKARFAILKRMAPYSFSTQRDIVIACITLHNYIRKESISDPLFQQYNNENVLSEMNIESENDMPEVEGLYNPLPNTGHSYLNSLCKL